MSEQVKSKRRVKKGVVLSNKMQKTLVVRVERTITHTKYNKIIVVAKKYYVHDELQKHQVGDKVTIMETRPLSKLKRWRVVNA
jgi:small subunit ribosomal protein S17